MIHFATEYSAAIVALGGLTIRPMRLASTPLMKPRTLCRRQPLMLMMSSSVDPPSRRSRSSAVAGLSALGASGFRVSFAARPHLLRAFLCRLWRNGRLQRLNRLPDSRNRRLAVRELREPPSYPASDSRSQVGVRWMIRMLPAPVPSQS